MLTHHDPNPRTLITPEIIRRDRIRRQKIALLQWWIGRTQEQIKSCRSCSDRSGYLLRKLVTLVKRRNALYTEVEARQMAKDRGLL